MLNSKEDKFKDQTIPFVQNGGDIKELRGNRAVLVGSATYISLHDISLKDYLPVKPRLSVSQWQSLFEKNPPKVFFNVNQDIINSGAKNVHFAFANDAYLQWGFATKGPVILLGGFSGEFETNLQVFHFENGKLIDTEERSIPGYNDLRQYTDTASTIIDQYLSNYPSAKVFYAAPLKKFSEDLSKIQYLDESLFKSLKFQILDLSGQKKSGSNFLPVTLCVLGVMSYVGLVGKGWMEYQVASDEFDSALKDPIVKEAGGVDPNLIDVIQQQRFYMQEAKTQLELSKKTRVLVNSVARIDDVRIKSMSVFMPPSKTAIKVLDKPDIRIILSVPNSGKLALDQAKDLLDIISVNSGLTLHMARQGFKDVESRREFTLEGFFNE